MRQSRYKYFAISDRDKKWGLYVLNCGESIVAAHDEYPPKTHPAHHYFQWDRGRILQEYQVFYLVRGEGLFESNETGLQPVKAGDMVILFPHIWHRYKPARSDWHSYWMGFDGEYARRLHHNNFFTPDNAILSMGRQDDIVRSFVDMQRIGHAEHAGYQQLMAGLAGKILADASVSQHRKQFQQSGQEKIIQRAQTLLVESIHHPTAMENIASQLGLGYSYFRRLFKQYTGLAPNQYLIQLRIERAKSLLSDPERPVKEIAAQTGFDSVYYFSRLFKEKTGLPPAQYRRMSLGHSSH